MILLLIVYFVVLLSERPTPSTAESAPLIPAMSTHTFYPPVYQYFLRRSLLSAISLPSTPAFRSARWAISISSGCTCHESRCSQAACMIRQETECWRSSSATQGTGAVQHYTINAIYINIRLFIGWSIFYKELPTYIIITGKYEYSST